MMFATAEHAGAAVDNTAHNAFDGSGPTLGRNPTMIKRPGDPLRCLGRNAAFPVVLVSTKTNFMAAAMAHYFCFHPPLIGVGIRPATHTFTLIQQEEAFVVNIPSADQADLVERAGTVTGRSGDKFAALGVTAVPAEKVPSSLIAECPVNIECRLVRQIDLGPERVWFVGQVEAVHEAEGFDPSQSLVYSNFRYFSIGPQIGQRRR
jgi:flavin reductase (DIM6/NTAB) family NADH-FMN oxidoreductase RutF